MRRQLALLIGLASAVCIALLIIFNYVTQAAANERQQIESLSRVLTLENQRLNSYVEELSTFSLQLRSNIGFMSIVQQTSALTYEQRQSVEEALKSSYYARGDLLDVQLYLARQKQCYAIDHLRRKVLLSEDADIASLSDYAVFTARPAFMSIAPDTRGFLRLTRAIIDAPHTTPLAVLRFTVDTSAMTELMQSHEDTHEKLCIFGVSGETYALPDSFGQAEAKVLRAGLQSGAASFTAVLDGVENLCVRSGQSDSPFVLVGCKPVSEVNAALIATRNGSIAIGLAALTVLMVLTGSAIRFIIHPLTQLAYRLRRVGAGHFTPEASLEGSFELMGLSEDVNHMITDIGQLIDRTYLATINERTAQLAALEAQTNPHFLFNTLQAIGAEALARGETDLYQMVAALGSILRYSVRGSTLVRLEKELSHVEQYLSLQQARFDDRLDFTVIADDELMGMNVPKLSLLGLVENSILHGLSGTTDRIHIEVSSEVQDDEAVLSVRDDGEGIDPDTLSLLRQTINDPAVSITQSIGLMNLASRLKLLYHGQARIELSSTVQPRQTTVTLRIPLEVLRNG